MSWTVPLIGHTATIQQQLEQAPIPNQGGEATAETSAQFTEARAAALRLIASGCVGTEGIISVVLSGHTVAAHGAEPTIPLETVRIVIERHLGAREQSFQAGPVTVTLAADQASEQPIEALTIDIARHQARVGVRSYQ